MKRIVSIDLGSKSMGVAISDENHFIAIPLFNFLFDEFDLDAAILNFETIIKEYEVDLVLLGYPKKTDGSPATIAKFIEKFKLYLDSIINVKYVDERFSTKRAKELITKKQKDQFKNKKDMLAAWVILHDYLQIKQGEKDVNF